MGLYSGFDVTSWSCAPEQDILQARITSADESFERFRQRNASEIDVCERPALVHSHGHILPGNRASCILFRAVPRRGRLAAID
jgi:hypothetical protein